MEDPPPTLEDIPLECLVEVFERLPTVSDLAACAAVSHLFKEGAIVAKKDWNLPKHPDIDEATNLEVIKLMTSLTSKDLVSCRFSWKHYYWFLTDEGIEYLRTYLALPAEIVPATHKKVAGRPEGRDREEDKFGSGGEGGRPAFRGGGDREYRGREGGFGRGGGM